MTPDAAEQAARRRWFPGEGEMARRMRALDWDGTDLGDPAGWPESLHTAVRICLTSRFPIVMWWGPTLAMLYNDAYVPMMGPTKHPRWLGRSGRECWREIWATIGPMLDGVMTTGDATWSEDLLLVLDRNLTREEAYFTFSYSPILDADRVGGIFCAVTETTERVVGERRLRTLRDLGNAVAVGKTDRDACDAVAAVLARNRYDIPFAALYLVDDAAAEARCMATVGVEAGTPNAPAIVSLRDGAGPWPLGRAWRENTTVEVVDLHARLGELSGGPWPEPPTRGVVVPIASAGQGAPVGLIVAGLSPRRVADDAYRSFVGLVAAHAASGIANARAYEEERRRAEALAELDRVKTAFFSNVSHEFRTPLTLMLGPIEDALAQADEALGPRTTERLTVAHRNSLRLLKLVNALLDFSRIEAGRIDATYEETDVCAFTAELSGAFRSACERAGLTLDVVSEPVTSPVYLDRAMWEKVIFNLLSNAFKFTHAGGIRVSVAEHDRTVVVRVEDTGTGIPVSELPHVFERFYRVRGAEGRTHEGTGIGLALVLELVKLHGGTITAESELGRGSMFTICIPTRSAHLPQERIGATRALASTANGAAPFVEEALRWLPQGEADGEPAAHAEESVIVRTAGARVLVADDNADMRAYVARLLAVHWRVEVVGDGESALAVIKRELPDLVLSDVMMPRLDGIGLLRAIRADPALRALPIILLSARAGEESRVEGADAGADDYLTKPFSARELVARVNAQLELARIRRESEEAVRRRGVQFATLLNEAPLGMYLVDADFRLREINPVARPIFGDLPELVGRDFGETAHAMWPREYADEVIAIFRHTLATGERYFAPERTERRRDGSAPAIYEWQVNRLPLPDGRFGVVCYFRDVSVQVRARQQLAGANERLTQANRQKDEFLAMLGHELRNPLAAVRNSIATASLDQSRRTRALEIARRQTDQLGRLIDDLLDVARITQGRISLRKQRVYLTQILEHAIENTASFIEARGLTLEVSIAAPSIRLEADPARLEQIFVNLLGNAGKYTEPGGRVAVEVVTDGGDAVVRIRDTGIGIAPDLLPRLWDLFAQADRSLDRSEGGLGIGLTVARRLVELHGGTISAHSDGLGCGAEFTVRLPALAGDAVEDDQTRPPVAAEARHSQARVMIVEDNTDAAESMEMLLEILGHRVTVVHDAVAALEAAQATPPDVMLVDIGLPGMNGYELAAHVRRDPRLAHIVLVALTGYGRVEDKRRALGAGFDHHLVKPVEIDALRDLVRRLASAPRDDASTVH